jgi:peptidyl-prolyl cis-trans isomerase B (cyclophilin B)
MSLTSHLHSFVRWGLCGLVVAALASGCTKPHQKIGGDKKGAKAASKNSSAKPAKKVELQTSLGAIVIELDGDKAPKTVANFSQYVRDGFYDGTIFHRVISTFMIQGGGFDENQTKKQTRRPIQNEADNGLKNERGTIAMARTGFPHSATAQFFINVKDNSNLDHRGKSPRGYGYCVFGKVVQGMDVVDKIKDTPVKNAGGAFANLPATPVVIKKVRVLE